MIGWNFLTYDEKSLNATPQSFVTAGGKTTSSTAVMCHVPFLGPRQCRVLTDCPPAISVRSEVMNYGVVFSYTRESGPSIALPDGTKVYLDDSRWCVPELHGYCKTDTQPKTRGKSTETLTMSGAADSLCLPCGQDPCPWPEGYINTTVTPQQATKLNDGQDTSRSNVQPIDYNKAYTFEE